MFASDFEFESEQYQQLEQAFYDSFENLADSLLNGDISSIIFKAFELAANNPLCVALIVCVLVLSGFHLFSSLTRSIR